jgi:hypothetical protein
MGVPCSTSTAVCADASYVRSEMTCENNFSTFSQGEYFLLFRYLQIWECGLLKNWHPLAQGSNRSIGDSRRLKAAR